MIVLCVYHVTWNVIIDTIVNVISEVWMWIVDRVVRLRQPGIASLDSARSFYEGSLMEVFKIKPIHFDTV